MKYSNQLRLARMASANAWNGGASALTLAMRVDSLFPGAGAAEIVTRVWTHPNGRASYECKDCGSEYLTADDAHECCPDCGNGEDDE